MLRVVRHCGVPLLGNDIKAGIESGLVTVNILVVIIANVYRGMRLNSPEVLSETFDLIFSYLSNYPELAQNRFFVGKRSGLPGVTWIGVIMFTSAVFLANAHSLFISWPDQEAIIAGKSQNRFRVPSAFRHSGFVRYP